VRVLLDENLPVELVSGLSGHQVETVTGLGWQGIQNGELLARMAGRFDALVTMDKNLKDQQPLAAQPFGVVLVRAASNRMVHLRSVLPDLLTALNDLSPGELRRVGV
jgi:predicted nuclease of predicted toxin-antitoxin system